MLTIGRQLARALPMIMTRPGQLMSADCNQPLPNLVDRYSSIYTMTRPDRPAVNEAWFSLVHNPLLQRDSQHVSPPEDDFLQYTLYNGNTYPHHHSQCQSTDRLIAFISMFTSWYRPDRYESRERYQA